jgi:hypothetical protein
MKKKKDMTEKLEKLIEQAIAQINEYERESIKDMDPLLDYQIRTIRQSLYTAKDYSTRIKLKHL